VLETALLLILALAPAPAQDADSVRPAARAARNAAWQYERLIVSTASEQWGGGRGDDCDERVGRFCFWFGTPDTPRRPIDPEAPEVGVARDHAIHAFRRWFALAPGDRAAAGPLLRYLLESERASEAVSAARAHVWAADASAESLLYLGLALHYARDFPAAEAAFDSARAVASPRERRRLDDLSKLLDPAEASRYRRLPEEDRARYETRFWALADPWLMEPGNERRSAHYARHAWSRILAQAPRVEGKLSWGRDHEELLLRYGRIMGRERIRDITAMPAPQRGIRLVEWFDPRRVALSPGSLLTGGIPYAPDAGIRPEIQRDTARSHYAPLGIRRTQGLVVQPSVFPHPEGGVIRIDAMMPPDTVDPRVPQQPRGLLVLLDTLGHEIARMPVTPRVRDDSVTVVSAEHRAPPGSYLYRVEVRDDSTGLAGLAQYRIDVPAPQGLALSDILVALPISDPPASRSDTALEATPALVLPPGQDVGVYAEVVGLQVAGSAATFQVQWWIERADQPGLLRRAARWVGERVGLVEAEVPTRVAWEEGTPRPADAVFVTLSLAGVDPGLHRLHLRVQDRVTGEERTTSRLIRIDPDARPLPRRGRS
jgi:hypothetical protein